MDEDEQGWDWCGMTWEGSRRAQLRRWMGLSLQERLQVLEDMDELAGALQEGLEKR